jgi:hypothetical protein
VRQQVLSSLRQEHAVPRGVAIKLDALVERHLAALLAVMAVGAALRFSTLTLQSYSLDEAVTVGLLDQSLRGMLEAIPHSEATPPIYYIIAWGWSKLFGTGEIALRSLSALLGTAAIPVTYAAARLLISRRGALIAAALVAVSPLLVWYSQEARAYVLLSFLGALSLLFFAPALEGAQRALIWWAAVSSLALATHYFAVFFIAPEATWLLIRLGKRRNVILSIGAVSAVAVALLPLAVYQERGGRTSWIHNNPLRVRLSEVATEFVGIGSLPHTALLGCAAGVLVVVGLLTWASAEDRRGGLLALAIGAAAVVLPLTLATAAHVAGHSDDYFYFRNMIGGWIPLAIAAAAVLGTRRAGILGAIMACALAALLLSSVIRTDLRPQLQRDDWRGAARALGAARATRAIVTDPDFKPLVRFYRPSASSMPTGGSQVDQLILITTRGGETLPGFHPPAAFVRTGLRHVQHLTLVYFRARAPQRIAPSQLVSPTSDKATVMLDAGRRASSHA